MQLARIITDDIDRSKIFNVSSQTKHKTPTSVAETYDEVIKETTERVSKEDLEYIVAYLMERRDYGFCAAVIMEANTGFRIGDILSLRVMDLFNIVDGEFVPKDYLTLREQKGKNNENKKPRTAWLNQAVKTILNVVVKGKAIDDFVFTNNGNKTSYFLVNEVGELVQVCTGTDRNGREIRELVKKINGKPVPRYNQYGIQNKIAPYNKRSTANKWKDIGEALGLTNYYRSHSLRKTYSYYGSIINQNEDQHDNRIAQCLLGHRDLETTTKYYMKLSPSEKKNIELNLNLGLETLQLYLNETTVQKNVL